MSRISLSAISLLAASGGFSMPPLTSSSRNEDPPMIRDSLPAGRVRKSGSHKCECGRTISANKPACKACSERRAA